MRLFFLTHSVIGSNSHFDQSAGSSHGVKNCIVWDAVFSKPYPGCYLISLDPSF